jgi:hypothetical protein
MDEYTRRQDISAVQRQLWGGIDECKQNIGNARAVLLRAPNLAAELPTLLNEF